MADLRLQATARPAAGILWMLLAGVCFVGVTAIAKHVGGRIPAAESAFLRFVLGLVFVLPMLGAVRAVRFDRQILRLTLARAAAHTVAVMFWFYAMASIPMAEVTAINYLNPVFVTLGAALFLGERLAARRLAAVAVALVGVLIILRPGLRVVEPGHLAMLVTALAFAGSYLVAGRMARLISPAAVVALMSLTVPVGLAPFALANWVTPTPVELAWLLGVAAFATAGHYSMTRAFAAAPLGVTQPVAFLQLVWSVLIGWAVFAEPVDGWVILGGGLILAAVSYIAWRETALRRRLGKADAGARP